MFIASGESLAGIGFSQGADPLCFSRQTLLHAALSSISLLIGKVKYVFG